MEILQSFIVFLNADLSFVVMRVRLFVSGENNIATGKRFVRRSRETLINVRERGSLSSQIQHTICRSLFIALLLHQECEE